MLGVIKIINKEFSINKNCDVVDIVRKYNLATLLLSPFTPIISKNIPLKHYH